MMNKKSNPKVCIVKKAIIIPLLAAMFAIFCLESVVAQSTSIEVHALPNKAYYYSKCEFVFKDKSKKIVKTCNYAQLSKQEKEQLISPISGNRLYFYSDVTRDSIYSLNRQIDELTKHLKFIQFSYDLTDPTPIELYISSEGGEVFPALSTVDKILNKKLKYRLVMPF
jgi:hypothetical protein